MVSLALTAISQILPSSEFIPDGTSIETVNLLFSFIHFIVSKYIPEISLLSPVPKIPSISISLFIMLFFNISKCLVLDISCI